MNTEYAIYTLGKVVDHNADCSNRAFKLVKNMDVRLNLLTFGVVILGLGCLGLVQTIADDEKEIKALKLDVEKLKEGN